jgi:serine/threonine protein phosphatase PrpC
LVKPQVLACQGVTSAYGSDVGQRRHNNEDSLSAFLALVPGYATEQELLFGFFVVADGMGGYEHGEVASQLAVRVAMAEAIERIYLKAIAGESINEAGETPAETIVRIIASANKVVAHEASRARNTMGTTIVCALQVGNLIYTGHVGDSRLYALRRDNGQLEQITTDHSVVQRLVDSGALTPEEAAMSPQRSLLYRSLGQPNIMAADTNFLHASDYTHLMLCSDGLWDMVDDATIANILRQSETAELACIRLINAANQNGGDDNVSTIVVKLAT